MTPYEVADTVKDVLKAAGTVSSFNNLDIMDKLLVMQAATATVQAVVTVNSSLAILRGYMEQAYKGPPK